MAKKLLQLRWLSVLAAFFWAVAALGTADEKEQAPIRQHGQEAEDLSSARVIVKFRLDSDLRSTLSVRDGRMVVLPPQHAADLGARLNIAMTNGRILGLHTQAIKAVGLSSSLLAERLAQMPDVEWAVVDAIRYLSAMPNDPYLGPDQLSITPTAGQWYLRAPDGTFASSVNALAAWEIGAGSPQVIVAVIDTGVRYDHPDLSTKLYPGYDFIADSSGAKDGDGRDGDASDPGDASAAGQCGLTTAQPSSWHGTKIAGLVGAATNNGAGMAGVGGDVMVLPVRVLGLCGGYDSDIIAGMRWAAGVSSEVGTSSSVTAVNPHPARVLNLSFGSVSACSASYVGLMQELTDQGVSVVAAAGNEYGLGVISPANCPGVIAVAAVRHLGTKVGYSSMGPEVTVSAPGGNCVNTSGPCLYPILTSTNSGATGPVASAYTNSFDASIGTSFSAPQVAGTIGLMLSLNPGLSPAAIRAALQASARPFPTGGAAPGVIACQSLTAARQEECYCTTSTCGAGMLDAAAALAMVFPPPTPVIAPDNSALQSSNSVFLSAAGSSAAGGRTVVAYQWSVVSGSQYASLLGRTSEASATLFFLASRGTAEVELTVTDSGGASATTRTVLHGAMGPATVTSLPGGGGGGSFGVVWAVALLLACVWLWAAHRAARQPRRSSR